MPGCRRCARLARPAFAALTKDIYRGFLDRQLVAGLAGPGVGWPAGLAAAPRRHWRGLVGGGGSIQAGAGGKSAGKAPASVSNILADVRGRGDAAVLDYAEKLAMELSAAGLEVLLDDRKASPGVKFTDAEVLGMPTTVVVGRGLADGLVEVRDRASGVAENVPVADALTHLLRVVGR